MPTSLQPYSPQFDDVARIDQLVTRVDEHCRQARHRNQSAAQASESTRTPTATRRAAWRSFAFAPGLHIGRTPHDDARHRQRADKAANRIADALRDKLAIVVRPLAAVHLVDRRCAQQRFRTGDECHHDDGFDQPSDAGRKLAPQATANESPTTNCPALPHTAPASFPNRPRPPRQAQPRADQESPSIAAGQSLAKRAARKSSECRPSPPIDDSSDCASSASRLFTAACCDFSSNCVGPALASPRAPRCFAPQPHSPQIFA